MGKVKDRGGPKGSILTKNNSLECATFFYIKISLNSTDYANKLLL